MRRTIFDHTPDGLKDRLRRMDRAQADERRRGDAPAQYVEPDADGIVLAGSVPKLLCMSATADPIASGGEAVTFDLLMASHGFTSGAGASWVHPVGGVYTLTYEHAWASYTGGGRIELRLDGGIVPEGLIADGMSGSTGCKTISYIAEADSVGSIVVTQSSGSAQVCDAMLWVAITDPTLTATASADEAVLLQITPAIPTRTATSDTELFFDETFAVFWNGTGQLLLAIASDGTGAINVDDQITVDVTHADGSTAQLVDTGEVVPGNVAAYFEQGWNEMRVRLQNTLPTSVGSSAIWLVQV